MVLKSVLIKGIAESILSSAIEKKLKKDAVLATPQAVQVAAEAAAPVLIHATNNEPWYQSRVTLGSGFVVLTSIGTIGAMMTGTIPFNVEMLAANIATILGSGFALYGRYAAKKPLGQ